MSDYRRQIEEAIQAIVLHSPTEYSWFGKRLTQLPSNVKRSLTSETARQYLLFNLQLQLYCDFYCRGFASPAGEMAAAVPPASSTPFVDQLSAANYGKGSLENGWEVSATREGEVIVQKRGLELCVRPEDCLVPHGDVIAAGRRLSLRFPKELLSISPGFYLARGDNELTEDSLQETVRFYWNLTPDGAVCWMKQATFRLNKAGVPFNLKVLNDRYGYSRCDAAVLYIRKSTYHDVAKILGEIYRDLSAHLKEATVAFAKVLAPGLGLAEEPGQQFSFGEHRCRLLADGIIRAYDRGKKSLGDKYQVVAERFAEDGIDLEKPFLNPGSSDDYDFQSPYKLYTERSRRAKRASQTDFKIDVYLRLAEAIAGRLSQEAVWHEDRCNWMGAEPVSFSAARRQPELSYRALGPDIYGGTSGVALFLAELHTVTGDAVTRRTALGAISQALSRVDALPASSRLGLYTGTVGIAFAAARVGRVLGEGALLEKAANLLRDLAPEADQEFDLLSGAAGAVVALIILRGILNDKSLIDSAVRLADNLLQAADNSDVGYSWRSPATPRQRNLTGFSHGAAGVGYALLELFHATGETKYWLGAERAFAYERHWFDAEAGNWPDFREEQGRGPRRSKTPLSFATLWCHGAPGIALSRLRALQILKDDTSKAEAIIALQTTRRTIRRWLYSGTENYSLCHGLAGNAEVLLYGCQVLGTETTEDRELVVEIANAGQEMYAMRGGRWLCGTGGGETPNLMLGLAGIGLFYLRLYMPQIPSILIPHAIASNTASSHYDLFAISAS